MHVGYFLNAMRKTVQCIRSCVGKLCSPRLGCKGQGNTSVTIIIITASSSSAVDILQLQTRIIGRSRKCNGTAAHIDAIVSAGD